MKLEKLKEKVISKPLVILLTLFLSLGALASVSATEGVGKTFVDQKGEVHTLDQVGDTVIITGNGFYGTAPVDFGPGPDDTQPFDGRSAHCDGPIERWHAEVRVPFLGLKITKYIAKCVEESVEEPKECKWYTITHVESPNGSTWGDFEWLDEAI